MNGAETDLGAIRQYQTAIANGRPSYDPIELCVKRQTVICAFDLRKFVETSRAGYKQHSLNGTFESCGARHLGSKLRTPILASPRPNVATGVRSTCASEPIFRTSPSPTSMLKRAHAGGRGDSDRPRSVRSRRASLAKTHSDSRVIVGPSLSMAVLARPASASAWSRMSVTRPLALEPCMARVERARLDHFAERFASYVFGEIDPIYMDRTNAPGYAWTFGGMFSWTVLVAVFVAIDGGVSV